MPELKIGASVWVVQPNPSSPDLHYIHETRLVSCGIETACVSQGTCHSGEVSFVDRRAVFLERAEALTARDRLDAPPKEDTDA